MKAFRKIILTLLIAAALLAAVFALGRYGWKLSGFRACQDAGIESVEVGETAVKVKGFCPGSFPEGFCGYYAEEHNGILYVGFRFSTVFGLLETGDFEVVIPVEGEIHKVVCKTGTSETTIWTAETGAASDSASDAADAPADVPPVPALPILDEIEQTVTIGKAGSSLSAVQAAVKLLDWGVNTGLGADEIGDAASAWLAAKNDELSDCLQKLALVDDAYQKLLTDEARELLDSAGCAEVEVTWGSEAVEPVEAIMRAAGLRG